MPTLKICSCSSQTTASVQAKQQLKICSCARTCNNLFIFLFIYTVRQHKYNRSFNYEESRLVVSEQLLNPVILTNQLLIFTVQPNDVEEEVEGGLHHMRNNLKTRVILSDKNNKTI